MVRALSNAMSSGRLHHAYMFTGTRGVGKTTVARILAKCLNCEAGVTSEPCGSCSACVEIKENRFMDLIEVDAASRTGVDDTRDLLENAQYLPSKGRFKVYLIDEVHMLSTASFNALLKTLEEPPEHVKFLLATTEPKKVPVTVLSRCLQFQLRNLSSTSIADYLAEVLKREGVQYESTGLEIISKNAQGSMRDALSLTDQAIAFGDGRIDQEDVINMLGVVGRNEVDAILEALESGSALQIIQFSAELAERNTNFVELLKGIIEVLHEMTVDLSLGNGLKLTFTAEELQLFYQIALVGFRDMHIVPDERSGFEMTMLRMLAFSPDAKSEIPRRTQAPELNSLLSEASVNESDDKGGSSQKDVVDSEKRQDRAQSGLDSLRLQALENQETKEKGASSIEPFFWASKIDALNLGGVSRMIAENSILLGWELPTVYLKLDQAHDTLLSDSLKNEICEALTALEGVEVSLRIDVGVLGSETVAEMKKRQNDERQIDAEETIKGDPAVSSILNDFEAELKEIKPVGEG